MWRQREDPWKKVADGPGWKVVRRGLGWGGMPYVQVRIGSTLVTAEGLSGDQVLGGLTRVRAFYLSSRGFHFGIRTASVRTELGKMIFHTQDIPVGEARFDRRFVVQGKDVETTRALFATPRLRALLEPHLKFNLVARAVQPWRPGEGFTGDARGLDELLFHVSGTLSQERLESVFEIFREVFQAWEGMSAPEGDEVEGLVDRLRARGGVISNLFVVVWDGNAPRRAAAARLGELGDGRAVPALIEALEADDVALRGEAVNALAALGDARAVSPVAASLGDRRPAAGRTMSELAAEALGKLGAADVVDAYHRALQGDRDPLRRAANTWHAAGPLARALVAVMEGSDLASAESAGRALALLGVMEVLPDLRRIQRATGWDRIREACRRTIAELESMASLPRPAAAGGGAEDTLPRVADEAARDTTTLPRSAAGEERKPRDREDDV